MTRIATWFPLWAVLGASVAYLFPEWLVGLKPAVLPLLGLVMFGMGVTLTLSQFAAVLRRPGLLGLGMALQFGVMPLAAWSIGMAMGFPPELLAGLILVGTAPGGTASNLVCYLAKGDVALSITLTTASTLAAVLLTPALTWLYLGESVPVPALEMLISIAQVVLAPLALGLLVNRWLGSRIGPVKAVFPLVSVAAIVLIIAIIVALNAGKLAHVGLAVVIAVALHNGIGLAAGYWLARLLGRDEATARTLAIEVGMQNSGLAVALAVKFFGPAAALPGAVFSIWHNLSGAALASWWSRRPASSPPGTRVEL
ncbi:bile acid:sodium symporter family protein [Thiocapsa sp. UBA6158]|jgi:BASS family bile acid:Na+ symporter|uniref:bile acid:sodium symporter family protein n=1 Tax=Thiocapsa sp. UBA6158 TaxID=1947692 RepID=UPI0025FB1D1C|nr:bile acid:sodium symporter family protein [Thiocapsa sp. UBA6158]